MPGRNRPNELLRGAAGEHVIGNTCQNVVLSELRDSVLFDYIHVVTLSNVTLPTGMAKSAGITSYVVESKRTTDVMAFATRADALEHYEEEVERCRMP